jgi:collagen type III alpha
LIEYQLWDRGGSPFVEVAGEQFRSKDIRRLFPARLPTSGMEVVHHAYFVPEPTNTHDRNAVRVEVDGIQIGYLPAAVAGTYQPLFIGMNREGVIPTTTCKIWGYESPASSASWILKGTEFEARARVVLDAPHMLVPATNPPRVPYRLLPHGSSLQVRGEEAHLDVLTPLVGPVGEAWVHGVLRAQDSADGKGKRTILIEVNGAIIGDLTPASSAHFLPVVDLLGQSGQLVVAKVLLTGNRIKVEAVVHAAKSHELDDSWLPPGTVTSPPLGSAAQDFVVPDKPRFVFKAPTGWPPVPEGFEPDAAWRPSSDWPTPPPGWDFWTRG